MARCNPIHERQSSSDRIDLNQIWEKQSVPEALAAKKEESWTRFRNTRIELDAAWERSLGAHAFVAPRSDMEAVEQEWERVRQKFLGDQRTIMGMAVRMGREYPPNSGGWIVGQVAALNWERLKMKPGFGPKKLREIVALFSAASGRR